MPIHRLSASGLDALLRAHDRSVHFFGENPNDQTIIVAFTPASLPGAPASSARVYQEELRRLLRFRLILVHLLMRDAPALG